MKDLEPLKEIMVRFADPSLPGYLSGIPCYPDTSLIPQILSSLKFAWEELNKVPETDPIWNDPDNPYCTPRVCKYFLQRLAQNWQDEKLHWVIISLDLADAGGFFPVTKNLEFLVQKDFRNLQWLVGCAIWIRLVSGLEVFPYLQESLIYLRNEIADFDQQLLHFSADEDMHLKRAAQFAILMLGKEWQPEVFSKIIQEAADIIRFKIETSPDEIQEFLPSFMGLYFEYLVKKEIQWICWDVAKGMLKRNEGSYSYSCFNDYFDLEKNIKDLKKRILKFTKKAPIYWQYLAYTVLFILDNSTNISEKETILEIIDVFKQDVDILHPDPKIKDCFSQHRNPKIRELFGWIVDTRKSMLLRELSYLVKNVYSKEELLKKTAIETFYWVLYLDSIQFQTIDDIVSQHRNAIVMSNKGPMKAGKKDQENLR